MLNVLLLLHSWTAEAARSGATAAVASRKSPAEMQTMLLIQMQQTFDMIHHMAATSNRQLRDQRNRIERGFLQTARDIGIAADYSLVEAAFERLAAEFCAAVETRVKDRQEGGHLMTVAFERQVDQALPYSRDCPERRETVVQVHRLWQKNDDMITDLLAKNRSEVQAAVREEIERGWLLYRQSKKAPAAGAEKVDWQKRLERQTAELVVQLHKVTERNLQAGVRQLKEFEATYTDMIKLMLTYERTKHSESLKKAEK